MPPAPKPRPKRRAAGKVVAAGPQSATQLATGISPLDYMLEVMRDANAEAGRRDDMAKLAAPYVHPRAATMQHPGAQAGDEGGGSEITIVRFADLAAE